MAGNPAQTRYPIIPGVTKAVADELTTLRRMIYQLQESTATTATTTASSSGTAGTATTTTASTGTGITTKPTFSATTGKGAVVASSNPNTTKQDGTQAYANVPLLATLPSTNPTQGQPYTNDGTVIDVAGALYRYNATLTTWSIVGGGGGGSPSLFDTHARRLSNYPSVSYLVNTIFYETDRLVQYVVQNATGTVTVTGNTNVAWVSGNHFVNTGTGFNAAQWPAGTQITINGIPALISSVSSPTALTLSDPIANGAAVAYTVTAGRWVYQTGTYADVYANIPTDLGENDYNATTGFKFSDTTHVRLFQWASTGGAPSSTSPGWNRAYGELPTGTIAILPFGPGYAGTQGWSLCNGTAGVSITQDDATTTNVNVPNLIGSYPKGGTTGTYSPTPNAAVAPTISGHTDSATTGDSVNTTSGTAVTSVTGTGISTTTGSFLTGASLSDPGHQHTLSSANAPVSISGGDPVSNVVVPFYMKR